MQFPFSLLYNIPTCTKTHFTQLNEHLFVEFCICDQFMFKVDITKIPVIGFIGKWLQSNTMDYGIHVTAVCVFMLYALYQSSPSLLGSAFSFFIKFAPIWFPIIAFDIFFMRWMDYVHKKFYLKSERVQYRIKLPPEVLKSPEAMDFVFHQIWSINNSDNYWETYIDGKYPLPISLEIVSIGGEVRFYINTHRKKGVETLVPAMYSQYPGVELIEEPVDYAAEIGADYENWEVWSTHFNKKEDLDKWGPIKTYIDFGLDKMPKEEEKIDPLTPLLELLGTASPNERMFVQYIISGYKKASFYNGNYMWPWAKEGPNWTKFAQKRIDEIMRRDPETKGTIAAAEDDEGMVRMTPGERSDVEAIERNMNKYGFNVAGRYLYMTKKGNFNANKINALNRALNQADVVGRSSMGVRWRSDFDYMWFSDPFGERLQKYRDVEYKLYQLRKYANHSQSDGMKVFTTEELATIFHLPGKVALTPTLDRVPSTRSEAPTNLPVGNLPI